MGRNLGQLKREGIVGVGGEVAAGEREVGQTVERLSRLQDTAKPRLRVCTAQRREPERGGR